MAEAGALPGRVQRGEGRREAEADRSWPRLRGSAREKSSVWSRPPSGRGCFTRSCPATITRFLPRSATGRKGAAAGVEFAGLPEGWQGRGRTPRPVAVASTCGRSAITRSFSPPTASQRTLMADAIDAATRDAKLLKDALAQAKQQEETVKVDVAAAKEEVAKHAASATSWPISPGRSRRNWPPSGRKSPD